VVEDEPTVAQLIADVMTGAATSRHTTDSREALARLEEQHYAWSL